LDSYLWNISTILGGEGELQTSIDALIGAQPNAVKEDNAAKALFNLAKANATMDTAALSRAFPNNTPDFIKKNEAQIKHLLLYGFTPRRFSVTLNIEQAPEGGVLPAARPFNNHL
jgi:hypothetical protein